MKQVMEQGKSTSSAFGFFVFGVVTCVLSVALMIPAWLANAPEAVSGAASLLMVAGISFAISAYLAFVPKSGSRYIIVGELPNYLDNPDLRNFDLGGMTFSVEAVNLSGQCVVHVCVQNRFANDCHVELGIWLGNVGTLLRFKLPGKGHGLYRKTVELPPKLWGSRVWLNASGQTIYPDGFGAEVRRMIGRLITSGTLNSTMLEIAVRSGVPIVQERSARTLIQLPSDLSERAVPLWDEFQVMTGEFPRPFDGAKGQQSLDS